MAAAQSEPIFKNNENMKNVLRTMMKDSATYPTHISFTDEKVLHVLKHHPKHKAHIATGNLRWIKNSFDPCVHNQRVLQFEQTPGIWKTIGWAKYAHRVRMFWHICII